MNEELNFAIDVPKLCSVDVWEFFALESKWEFFTLIPHREEIMYKTKDSDVFLFDYSKSKGITSIYYKDKYGFNIPENKDKLEEYDFDSITNFSFPVANDIRLFKCEND